MTISGKKKGAQESVLSEKTEEQASGGVGDKVVTETTKRVLRSEIWVGDFTRKIELPCEVESEKIKATLKNGILSLLMPIKEKEKQRSIKIKGE